jgi:glycosyltransferase involved in cell wall biosynthesis
MYHFNLPVPGRKPGGVAVWVHRLAEVLVKRGHAVTVHTYSDAPAERSYTHQAIATGRLHATRAARMSLNSLLLNRVDWGNADVVHLHGDDWFLSPRRLPSVRTLYGSALIEAATANRLRRQLSQAALFPLERRSVALADAAYAIGSDGFSLFEVDGMLACGIDAPPTVPPAAQRAPAILFVGTWLGRKRGRLLYDVFSREVRPAYPQAELWVVADRCEEGPGVRFFGSPSDAELFQLFEQAAIFCLPSRYEGFGIPYLEAMAYGPAVVASPNPGAAYLLEGGRTGLITDDPTLGHALVGLLKDPDARQELQERGRERVRAFTWELAAEQHERAYDLAIERFASRR